MSADYLWDVVNPMNFGESSAVDKMNDMLLSYHPSTPAREVGSHGLAMGIAEREQPSIHDTLRRLMTHNAGVTGA